MPRYWVCNRCGTYNLGDNCETCGLTKVEAQDFEEIRESDPFTDDEEDQEDWFLTSRFEEEEEELDWEEEW